MPKFKGPEGKQVMGVKRIMVFAKGEFETDDPAEVKALDNAIGVERVKGRPKKQAAED